jgi:hypothetical protein
MTYRTDILSRVRAELNDNGGSQVWSDALVYSWLNEALNQVSLDLPRAGYTASYLIPGQREYPLSGLGVSVALGLQIVEAPRGYRIARGDVHSRQDGANRFQQQNTILASDQATRIYDNVYELYEFAADQPYLVFRYAPVPLGGASDLLYALWYQISYANPPDDVTPLDVDSFNEVMLVWYICGRALSWLAEQRGKRGDIKQTATTGYYQKLYARGLEQRTKRTVRTARMVQDG